MANTLTGLIQTIYTELDVVSRALVGLIPQVNRDAKAETAAIDTPITYPETEAQSSATIAPSMTIPEGTAQTINANTLTISNQEAVLIPWNGEEIKSLKNAGTYSNLATQQIQQAFRTISDKMEQDLLTAGVLGASRAIGTAGTAPFGTADDMSDLANIEVLLDDNGAPSGRSLVLMSRGYGNLRAKQSGLFHANEAGDSMFLRSDVLGQVYNMSLGKTGAKYFNSKGTGASYILNGATTDGATSIPIDTGTGTILEGNVVTIGGDKYVVKTGVTAPGSLVINKPGSQGIIADSSTVTVGATYEAAGLAFSRDGLLLATRLPAMPEGGDAALDEMIVTDPHSGISFRVALYQGYHKQMIEVSAAWGVKAVKPAHISLLLG